MSTVTDSQAGRDVEAPISPPETETSNSTPNTVFSPPYSPPQKVQQLLRDTRVAARKKLDQLTLEEKVRPNSHRLAIEGFH